MDRRTLIKTGVAGAALLAVAGGTSWLLGAPPHQARATVLRAVIPALLEGALPASDPERAQAVSRTVEAVEAALAQLAPSAQHDAHQLFALLASAPGRMLMAGVASDWQAATTEQVAAFLQSWRTHRFSLMRSGYGALHDLVLASWYADPTHWPAIGYPGPRSL
jgi:hypothetical protein